MKKKTIANLIMVGVILVIIGSGILGVGFVKGWFDEADNTQAFLRNIRGVVMLNRDGVSYLAENNTVLRSGDHLNCQSGASAVLQIGGNQVVIGEKAVITVSDPKTSSFSAQVETGEVFAHCDSEITLYFGDKSISISQATALLSIRSGAQSISVFRGNVEQAAAGQTVQYFGAEQTVTDLHLESLNDFAIAQIRNLNDSRLCFTLADLDRLASDRQQAMQALIDSQTAQTVPDTTADIPATEPEITDPEETAPQPEPTEASLPTSTEPNVTEPSVVTEPFFTEPVSTEPEVTEPTDPPQTEPPAPVLSCTIAIYCDTILNNMDDLEPGKAEFVPSDGAILYPVSVTFTEGETVFDVLKRVCSMTGIQLEYSWTPLYNSYYVEGIYNLYEFDCGFESGWMYKVNGWFPNYGCSSYTLKDGDVIVWAYTCEGLGADVGAPRM